MNRLSLYRVNIDYIKYLWSYDNRVQYNPNSKDAYTENRPYVGIVISINNLDYFAPLEHPRDAHKNLKSNGILLKIEEGKYGLIAFNNMIPIDRSHLIAFDIQKETLYYQNILSHQLNFCNDNKDVIRDRAQDTYMRRTQCPNNFIKKNCCNFTLLEEKCKLFRIS